MEKHRNHEGFDPMEVIKLLLTSIHDQVGAAKDESDASLELAAEAEKKAHLALSEGKADIEGMRRILRQLAQATTALIGAVRGVEGIQAVRHQLLFTNCIATAGMSIFAQTPKHQDYLAEFIRVWSGLASKMTDMEKAHGPGEAAKIAQEAYDMAAGFREYTINMVKAIGQQGRSSR